MSIRDNIHKHAQAGYKAALNGRSRSKAIRAMCMECCGYQLAEVRKCTDKGCPLWKYRIGTVVDVPKDES